MLINAIDQKGLLPGHAEKPCPGTHHFWGMDTPEQWRKMLTIKPQDWLWRDPRRTVLYTLNSQGYRCPEFDTIDWPNSTVILGCSNVFGDGVDNSQTISANLSRISGRPVINLGQGGTGTQFHLHNQCLLNEHYPTPWAVVVLWPDSSRDTLYQDPGATPLRGGSWNMTMNSSSYWYNQGANADTLAWMASRLSRAIWQGRSQYVEAVWNREQAETLGIPCIYDLLVEPGARDGVHPGPTATENVARWINSQLTVTD
jgi:hypothetical protein